MEEGPRRSVFFHFRFKFLAITCIAFLIYIILSAPGEFSDFVSTAQFKLVGPFFMGSGVFYFLFRKFPLKCPYCLKVNSAKRDWLCPDCNKKQGKERVLVDKCVHCKQILSTAPCTHCKEEFRL